VSKGSCRVGIPECEELLHNYGQSWTTNMSSGSSLDNWDSVLCNVRCPMRRSFSCDWICPKVAPLDN